MKIIGLIGLFCLGAQVVTAAECTAPEVIAGGVSLLESIAVLCGFAGFGTGAVLIKKIITGGRVLSEVLRSLDENPQVNNLHLLSTAGNQGNTEAVKQFMRIAGVKPDGSGRRNAEKH